MKVQALIGIIGIMVLTVLNGAADAATEPAARNTVKLQPRVRMTELDANSTPAIEMNKLLPFLKASLILDTKKSFDGAPYVVAQEGNQIGGSRGSTLYVKGIEADTVFDPIYSIFKAGQVYVHPTTKELLGFEACAIGAAKLLSGGEIARFEVTNADEIIEVGARLLPNFTAGLPAQLTMRPAKALKNDGYILSVRDGIDQIGAHSIVVISLGQRDGVEEGNILEIYKAGEQVVDSVGKRGWRASQVQLPDRRVGNLMVYQTYEKLSIALVLEAKEIVRLLDKIKSQ